MRAVLVGYGEIGKAVKSVFDPFHEIEVCEIDRKPEGQFDIMLVAIPYVEGFEKTIEDYREEFGVKAIIFFATLAIGTTSKFENAVHSPVEGKHPDLAESIQKMPRWVGGYNEIVGEFFEKAEIKPRYVDKPEFTEFLKLRSTSKYGINIQFARYEKSVCDDLEMSFDLIKKFDQDYNDLYEEMGMPQFKRYILDAPEGKIGGHCVVPNAKILDNQYPSELLKQIYKEEV
ncbi:MAG: hypothetical protein M0R80_18440 [Proteobacteria bacterium]|jgi:hypothetical protein|nr:hypothetical protein [Pseudomonadota bacterium]